MFASLQQKDISGFLTYLWQTDPFKAKWSILAKAYSLIRDSKGKDKAPLDSYLAINGPLIGIVPPEQYLEMLGWKIVAGDDGERLLRRDFDVDISSFDQDLLTSNVSVNDIIKYSCTSGYIAADEANLIIPDNEPAMTMATSVQHNLSAKSAYSAPMNNLISDVSGPTTAVTMLDADDAFEQDLSRALRAEAEKDGTGSKNQDEELVGEPFDEENDIAISLADYEATQTASSLNIMDTGSVASMSTASVVVTEAGLNDSEAVANTETGLAPQVSISTWQVAGQAEQAAVSDNPLPLVDGVAWLDLPAQLPAPNPVNLLSNIVFPPGVDARYPFNNYFAPEHTGFQFDPFMGDFFNAYDMSDYFKFMNYPGSG